MKHKTHNKKLFLKNLKKYIIQNTIVKVQQNFVTEYLKKLQSL